MNKDEYWTAIIESDRGHLSSQSINGELNYWARKIGFQRFKLCTFLEEVK